MASTPAQTARALVYKVVAFKHQHKQQQKHLTCMTSYQSLVLSVVPVYMDLFRWCRYWFMDASLHHAGGSSRSIQSESPLPSSQTVQTETPKSKPFTPFCNVDQVQISIHCHINAVKSLLCVPGLVPKDLGKFLLFN